MKTQDQEKLLLASMAKNISELNQYIRSLEQMMQPPDQTLGETMAPPLFELPPDREKRLQDAILDAINELEESRKAFKSKRLEHLRKRLTQALIESR